MSFDPRLEARWNAIIRPAISEVSVDGKILEPYRVDSRSVSDSILTEILAGVGGALLVFGDVTSLDTLNSVPLRNPNVFYEIGIAHAMRLPEEVLLFRSDEGPLLFDVANIRINQYDPDGDPEEARAKIIGAVSAAVKEINLTRSLVVESYASRLDSQSWIALLVAQNQGFLEHPLMRTVGQAVSGRAREAAITSLLELGLIETTYGATGPELVKTIKEGGTPLEQVFRYQITNLGQAVLQLSMKRLGIQLNSAPKGLTKGEPGSGNIESQ